MFCDLFYCPSQVGTLLLPGEAHNSKCAAPLIKGVSFDALLADKALKADWLSQDLNQRSATAAIPPKPTAKSRPIITSSSSSGYIWWRMISKKSKSSVG